MLFDFVGKVISDVLVWNNPQQHSSFTLMVSSTTFKPSVFSIQNVDIVAPCPSDADGLLDPVQITLMAYMNVRLEQQLTIKVSKTHRLQRVHACQLVS